MEGLNMSMECTRESRSNGTCFGLAVCGFCYDFAETRQVSKEYEQFNLVVIGLMLPAIGCLGLIGNTLSAFTYSRREMISSLNVYLFALACSDIVIILTAFFLFFLENMRKRSEWATYYFAVLSPVMFPLGLTAQTISVFITVASAFDCLVLVAASDKFKSKFCSVNTSIIVIVKILLLGALYNSPHMYEIYVIDCWSTMYNTASKDVCPTALRADEDYVRIYYVYMYTIVMAVGPVFLLVIINSAIVISMRRSSSPNSESDIITLVLVVCLFISCNVLPLTVNFLELLFGIINSYLIDLSNLMVVVNSSCNFLIYYTFGSNFRRTLRHYLRNAFNWNAPTQLANNRTPPRVKMCLPPTECCNQGDPSPNQPCMTYDSSMMAATLDEAMFTFPNLASPDQSTLFKPSSGFGGAGGESEKVNPDPNSVGDQNEDTMMPMASVASGPSVMTTKVSIAAYGAGTPLGSSMNGECPTYACMSCKMALLNGFLANPNIGAADNATMTAQRNALAQRLGTTQGSCDQNSRKKRFSEGYSTVNKHKLKKRLAKRFVLMNTTPDTMNDDELDNNSIDGNESTDNDSNSGAVNSNGAKNKPPVLGVVTGLGCQYRRGEALETNSEWCGLCNLCWQWRKLPSDYYPNYLNEVNCDHNDDGCLSGFGECKPILRPINVMRKKGDEWVKESIDTTTACECQVEIGSSLHGLVVK
ncbi:hypothetical protein B9Z55_024971 [Caenorhabditis nigoni]|uniref:G-protein coupled receptors family 1 profile domain-containing protein n=1 Tax=Caenorhabditis nigoni TaxID=1611254 RepID=A0A2G5SWA2_9PELO|nr:hypothetical protein B9Z55_024971 [Caenorhabditis nigoni]